jgi:nucleoside-diphosphate-sugar epimerase
MRDVPGVLLAMPWSHRLPDYARFFPAYGQNLVDLAVGLGEIDKPLGVMDVGATIGDSADPRKPDGTPRKLLDVSVLRAVGWQPSIPLRAGIEATVAWYRANTATARK